MFGFGDDVFEKISEHNSAMRVITKKYRSDLSEILFPPERSLLVTGGNSVKRLNILCRAVSAVKSSSPHPCVILTSNPATEQALIGLANSGMIGQLYVCSDSYREYDVFSGMNRSVIAEFFTNLAEYRGYKDSSRLHNYAMAFLKVLELTINDPLTLTSITEFSTQNNDIAITQHASSLGLDDEYNVLSDPSGGRDFRAILSTVNIAFSSLTTLPCSSGFSITNALKTSSVTCIRSSTTEPNVLGLYFAQLFKAVDNRCFHLFLDDSDLLSTQKFVEQIERLKKKPGIFVNLFSKNACLYDEELFSHFSRQIILLDDTEIDSSDIQLLFNKCFGEYTAYDIGTGSSKPAHLLFSLEKSPQYNTVTYTRPKLLVEETIGYEAVIKGHSGSAICMIRRII